MIWARIPRGLLMEGHTMCRTQAGSYRTELSSWATPWLNATPQLSLSSGCINMLLLEALSWCCPGCGMTACTNGDIAGHGSAPKGDLRGLWYSPKVRCEQLQVRKLPACLCPAKSVMKSGLGILVLFPLKKALNSIWVEFLPFGNLFPQSAEYMYVNRKKLNRCAITNFDSTICSAMRKGRS